MKIINEYWEAVVKLHISRPSSFLFLLAGLTFAALAFVVEQPIARVINALPAMLILYLYVDSLRLVVDTQRDFRQKFIDSLDD